MWCIKAFIPNNLYKKSLLYYFVHCSLLADASANSALTEIQVCASKDHSSTLPVT